MSGSVIPVNPGLSPTQLTGTTNPNFTLYNLDPVNAIWVADSRSVSPGNGMRLGPLANMLWTKEEGDAYACVDTGVLTTVRVNISDDVENVNSPVDVATATATALLAQGIPNVLLTKELFSAIVNPGLSVGAIDVSSYASLELSLELITGTGNIVVQCSFSNPATLNIETFFLSVPFDSVAPNSKATWQIPVSDARFGVFVIGSNPNNVQVEIVGSNRQVPKLRQMGNAFLPRRFSFTGNWAANAVITLAPVDGINEQLTRFNGPVKLSWEGTAVAITGQWLSEMLYADPNSVGAGALQYVRNGPIITASNTIIDWYHPSVPVQWQARSINAVTGGTVILTVAPAGAGL